MSRTATRSKPLPKTPDELHRDMQAFAAKLRKDQPAARAFLHKAGILTPGGRLSSRYSAKK